MLSDTFVELRVPQDLEYLIYGYLHLEEALMILDDKIRDVVLAIYFKRYKKRTPLYYLRHNHVCSLQYYYTPEEYRHLLHLDTLYTDKILQGLNLATVEHITRLRCTWRSPITIFQRYPNVETLMHLTQYFIDNKCDLSCLLYDSCLSKNVLTYLLQFYTPSFSRVFDRLIVGCKLNYKLLFHHVPLDGDVLKQYLCRRYMPWYDYELKNHLRVLRVLNNSYTGQLDTPFLNAYCLQLSMQLKLGNSETVILELMEYLLAYITPNDETAEMISKYAVDPAIMNYVWGKLKNKNI